MFNFIYIYLFFIIKKKSFLFFSAAANKAALYHMKKTLVPNTLQPISNKMHRETMHNDLKNDELVKIYEIGKERRYEY